MLLITILSQFIISLYKRRDNSSSILPFLSPNLLRSDARAARVRRSVSPDISKLGKKRTKKPKPPQRCAHAQYEDSHSNSLIEVIVAAALETGYLRRQSMVTSVTRRERKMRRVNVVFFF